MKLSPKISIIIPCYNSERFIQETIYSVLNQSFQDFELIIINDGSTDKSEQKILQISDYRIKYFSKTNTGVSHSRNFGLTKSNGDYVVFLDSDDLLSKHYLLKRIEYVETHRNIQAVCSNVITIDSKSNIINSTISQSAYTLSHITLFNKTTTTCPSGYLFKKDFLINQKLFFNQNLNSSADKFFLLEFFTKRQGIIAYLPNTPFYYRISPTSMSNQISIQREKDQFLFINEVKKLSQIYNLKKSFFARLYYTLSATNFHLKNYYAFLYYFFKSTYLSPVTVFKLIIKKT